MLNPLPPPALSWALDRSLRSALIDIATARYRKWVEYSSSPDNAPHLSLLYSGTASGAIPDLRCKVTSFSSVLERLLGRATTRLGPLPSAAVGCCRPPPKA
jgi:hypothetical protein